MQAVVLDSAPLGILTHSERTVETLACKNWLASLVSKQIRVVVPEIVDYELRRELLRSGKINSIQLLDAFNNAEKDRYVPLTTDSLRLAASLWAQIRQQGKPTADHKSLDIDVILAAQALSLGLPAAELIIATSNPRHLTRFAAAELWQNIQP